MLVDTPLDNDVALDAVVDAALAGDLTGVTLSNCSLSPASAPALARLLRGGGALTRLFIWGEHARLLDARAAERLGSPAC